MFKRKIELTSDIQEEISKQIVAEFKRRDAMREKYAAMDKARVYLTSHEYARTFWSYWAEYRRECGCTASYPHSWENFEAVTMKFCDVHSPLKDINFPYKVA